MTTHLVHTTRRQSVALSARRVAVHDCRLLDGCPTFEVVMNKLGLSVRVDLGGYRFGPGKVALLEAIALEGSISAAARCMKMSYRRPWELAENLHQAFGTPVVTTVAGGSRGGGTSLTPMGEDVVSRYRAIEQDALKATEGHLTALACHVARDEA